VIAHPKEPAPDAPEGGRTSFLDHLSGRGPILLAVPTTVTLALAVAVFAGGLAIEWFLLGAMVAGPLVAAAILAVDTIRPQHR
jgi:hypothetical protein